MPVHSNGQHALRRSTSVLQSEGDNASHLNQSACNGRRRTDADCRIGTPLDAVIRDAIGRHVARIGEARSTDVFGLWRHRARSGIDYQRDARAEWSCEPRRADG
ncbi:hypothetical protein [Burkholderia multivorans]|uniref:hypothetical protein n=1 Tax=Burkholderia multivorans TaxID=87883 RepID=UPI0020B18CEE|nr:hypothetical protein [Burkholderia multivorans]